MRNACAKFLRRFSGVIDGRDSVYHGQTTQYEDVECAAHAEELSVAPVLEQLRSRRIRAIRFMQGTSGNAFLLPERGGTFEILVSRYIPLEWPLCIGHEIAHSYFMIWSDDLTTFHRANGSGSQYAKAEEELCEIFAEIWIRSSNNYRETFELISRLYPPR